ncbi:FAD-binding oxidoreductase [Piscinibacter gummiphilus]|uniref:FAD-binding oxidoreductase n=1 Tax=Piscinibacter gummiphilus TaxID=946333 RepID=A0ABZ0D0W1_9BURK|nr:FAD-binding oxidoreductase [Piscinibacter gummiphilus]WOB10802.1 FAD-binding oxidoreductase [Piscinibacter gummiphilus]
MGFLATDQALARDSYYDATAARPTPQPPLQGDLACDVAIVGAGLAGLSAAIELADRGYRVAVLEARQVGTGASGRNGGQAIAGLACDLSTIEAQLGDADARMVWNTTLEALDLIAQRSARFGIECEWQPGYLSLAVSARKGRALQDWLEQMQRRHGYDTTWIAPAEISRWIDSPCFHSGYHDPRSGHLNPLKYTLGLARAARELGVQIHEGTPVTAITPGSTVRLHTPHGDVHAAHVLLAGNVYLQGLAPALADRIMPVGTYIIASEPLDPALLQRLIPSRSAVCDTNFVLDYFRPTADHRMLYGGRVSYSTATPANLAASMQRRMAQTFPQLANARVAHAWGGFVDITMNRAPDFGRLHPNVYYLQGFSGHGVALTGLAGRLVAEAIAGQAERFDVYARLKHRPFPGGRLLRTPALVLGMAYYRLRDLL